MWILILAIFSAYIITVAYVIVTNDRVMDAVFDHVFDENGNQKFMASATLLLAFPYIMYKNRRGKR